MPMNPKDLNDPDLISILENTADQLDYVLRRIQVYAINGDEAELTKALDHIGSNRSIIRGLVKTLREK